MSIYPIGMQFRHPSSWQWTFVDFAETSLHPPPPHARSSTPQLPCQRGNAALWTSVKYCQMMGKKWKSWERRKRKHFRLPGRAWLMTSAPAGWRWWQRELTDNGMPAVEFAHFMLFLVTWFWGRPNFFDIWPCKFESWYIILHLRPPRVAVENVLQAPGTELIKARNERKLNMNARGPLNEGQACTAQPWPSGDERTGKPRSQSWRRQYPYFCRIFLKRFFK